MAWATNSEADTYLSETIGGASWEALTESEKTTYLTTAYRDLSNDPQYSFPATASQKMIDANIEYAFFLLSNSDSAQVTNLAQQGVASFNIGTFSMSLRGDAELGTLRTPYPQKVLNLISDYQNLIPARGRITRKVRTDGKC